MDLKWILFRSVDGSTDFGGAYTTNGGYYFLPTTQDSFTIAIDGSDNANVNIDMRQLDYSNGTVGTKWTTVLQPWAKSIALVDFDNTQNTDQFNGLPFQVVFAGVINKASVVYKDIIQIQAVGLKQYLNTVIIPDLSSYSNNTINSNPNAGITYGPDSSWQYVIADIFDDSYNKSNAGTIPKLLGHYQGSDRTTSEGRSGLQVKNLNSSLVSIAAVADSVRDTYSEWGVEWCPVPKAVDAHNIGYWIYIGENINGGWSRIRRNLQNGASHKQQDYSNSTYALTSSYDAWLNDPNFGLLNLETDISGDNYATVLLGQSKSGDTSAGTGADFTYQTDTSGALGNIYLTKTYNPGQEIDESALQSNMSQRLNFYKNDNSKTISITTTFADKSGSGIFGWVSHLGMVWNFDLNGVDDTYQLSIITDGTLYRLVSLTGSSNSKTFQQQWLPLTPFFAQIPPRPNSPIGSSVENQGNTSGNNGGLTPPISTIPIVPPKLPNAPISTGGGSTPSLPDLDDPTQIQDGTNPPAIQQGSIYNDIGPTLMTSYKSMLCWIDNNNWQHDHQDYTGYYSTNEFGNDNVRHELTDCHNWFNNDWANNWNHDFQFKYVDTSNASQWTYQDGNQITVQNETTINFNPTTLFGSAILSSSLIINETITNLWETDIGNSTVVGNYPDQSIHNSDRINSLDMNYGGSDLHMTAMWMKPYMDETNLYLWFLILVEAPVNFYHDSSASGRFTNTMFATALFKNDKATGTNETWTPVAINIKDNDSFIYPSIGNSMNQVVDSKRSLSMINYIILQKDHGLGSRSSMWGIRELNTYNDVIEPTTFTWTTNNGSEQHVSINITDESNGTNLFHSFYIATGKWLEVDLSTGTIKNNKLLIQDYSNYGISYSLIKDSVNNWDLSNYFGKLNPNIGESGGGNFHPIANPILNTVDDSTSIIDYGFYGHANFSLFIEDYNFNDITIVKNISTMYRTNQSGKIYPRDSDAEIDIYVLKDGEISVASPVYTTQNLAKKTYFKDQNLGFPFVASNSGKYYFSSGVTDDQQNHNADLYVSTATKEGFYKYANLIHDGSSINYSTGFIVFAIINGMYIYTYWDGNSATNKLWYIDFTPS